MFHIFSSLKWVYQKFKVSAWLPFFILFSYTLLGAAIFKALEQEADVQSRKNYKKLVNDSMHQVAERMLEVKCDDIILREDRKKQLEYAREALAHFLNETNLEDVIMERTKPSPWTWLGSMFYAGQLYTTIGYGVPITQTVGGRVASIFYILFGIPVFLIILKDMGRLLSRALRKLYKRISTSRRKIAETAPMKKLSSPFMGLIKSDSQKVALTVESQMAQDAKAVQQNRTNTNIENAFPIPIALTILFLWILLSSALFCIWEKQWGFLTAVYFFFVSISTVGLGDILFHDEDMMIVDFLLILIGLALLSMTINLIQAALERLLDRLLEEYIEEIEKMAEIVANEEFLDEEAMPLEFKMSGGLLTLPMKKVTAETGLFAEAKGWMAEKIANNLLASRLGKVDESEEEDGIEEEMPVTEMEEEGVEGAVQRAKVSEVTVLEGGPLVTTATTTTATPHRHASISKQSSTGSRRASTVRVLPHNRYNFQHNKPLFNTIKTLERIKPQGKDLRSMIFSKFLQSDKLDKIVGESALPQKKMTTVSTQTEVEGFVEPKLRKPNSRRRKCMRIDSNSSFSTINTSNSAVMDDESLLSTAYCDLKFEYSDVSTPSINRLSTGSMMRMDDDDLMFFPKLSTLTSTPISSPRKSPQLRIQTRLPSLAEYLTPSPNIAVASPTLFKHYPSESELTSSAEHSAADSDRKDLDRLMNVCGLMPADFETSTISSRSTSMFDSGYEPSQSLSHKDPAAAKNKMVVSKTDDSIREESSPENIV